MKLDCGEDNWGYVFDDDELTGYYCLNDDTANDDFDVNPGVLALINSDCGEGNWRYVYNKECQITGGYACIEAQTMMTRYPVGDPAGDCDGNGVEVGMCFGQHQRISEDKGYVADFTDFHWDEYRTNDVSRLDGEFEWRWNKPRLSTYRRSTHIAVAPRRCKLFGCIVGNAVFWVDEASLYDAGNTTDVVGNTGRSVAT